MIGLVVICVLKSWKERVRKEWLKIGIILTSGELAQFIRYYVWGVLERSFIIGWIVVKRKLGGSIWGGGMFNYSW